MKKSRIVILQKSLPIVIETSLNLRVRVWSLGFRILGFKRSIFRILEEFRILVRIWGRIYFSLFNLL